MVNLTLSIPRELKKELDRHPEMNWSEVARQAFKEKVANLDMLEKFSSKFKLSQKNAKQLADKINLAVSKRFLEEK